MGSLGLSGTSQAAFDSRVFARGIDWKRTKRNQDPGIHVADPAATFREGQMLAPGSAGLTAANITDVIGVSLADKIQLGFSVVVDEAVVLNGTTASNLTYPNVSNVQVRSAQNFTGTLYTLTTDYTVSAANGTVTRNGAGAIADGATVYVSYTFALTAAQVNVDGQPFHSENGNDEVTSQAGRVAIMQGPGQMFTTEWSTLRTYTITGATSNLYCDAGGRFDSTQASGADFVGKCFQLPTATDRYMGVFYNGIAVAT